MIRYIMSHWRGEQSLGQSYWVNSVVVTLGMLGLIFVSTLIVGQLQTPAGIVAWFVGFYTLLFTVYVWQVMGTWRSANRYRSPTGSRAWAYVVYGLLVLGVLQTLPLVGDAVRQITDAVQMATGTDRMSKFEVKVINPQDLRIEGYIAFGLPEQLTAMLAQYPQVKFIHLHSLGGRAGPAQDLIKIIQAKELTTFAQERCLSICAYVFLAGKERIAKKTVAIGFHQTHAPGVAKRELSPIEGEFRKLVESRGASPAFVTKLFSTPPESLWTPTLRLLVDNGVVTTILEDKKLYMAKDFCRTRDCGSAVIK
ncbi:MAG TPA: hypothetical protein VF678_01790 [bacterium]